MSKEFIMKKSLHQSSVCSCDKITLHFNNIRSVINQSPNDFGMQSNNSQMELKGNISSLRRELCLRLGEIIQFDVPV